MPEQPKFYAHKFKCLECSLHFVVCSDFERSRSNNDSSTAHFYIGTMKEMDNMLDVGGPVHIMDVLKFIRSCFAGEALMQQAMTLAGVSRFLKLYPEVKRAEIIEKMRRVGQTKLTQNALQWMSLQGKGGISGARGKAYAEAMLLIYNHNRQEANRVKSKV